jgi:3-methyl-2-oxobutanoate hydroxymethyltransferase
MKQNRLTANNIIAKKNQQKIICLTAYTYPIAKILDDFCDIILVGDSLGMAIYGHKDTLAVTLEMIINHTKAVVAATKKSLILADLPFGAYEKSKSQAFDNALRVIKETGCDALKLETSLATIETIDFLTKRGIPVVAHVGLLCQHVKTIGGYKYQGREEIKAKEILETAILAERAGAFAIVIEEVVANLADKITIALKIPTIGIGASVNCDGQVLVIDDLLGLNQEFKPKFVKNYCNLAKEISNAVQLFSVEVKEKKFPAAENIVE